MTARRSTLTGSWSGAYRFPNDAQPEVVFNAQIEDIEGAFTGALQEPNVYGLASGSVITSDIEGTRTGQSVVFTKFYDGSGGMAHAVRYEGIADTNLSRVDGKWSIPRDWSGTFFMVRDDCAEEAAVERAESADIKR
jgi:hypothetical protein